MEMIIQPQFITDSAGQKLAIISLEEYNSFVDYKKMIEEQEEEREMLEDIEAYKQAKSKSLDYEPFDEVLKRIQESNG